MPPFNPTLKFTRVEHPDGVKSLLVEHPETGASVHIVDIMVDGEGLTLRRVENALRTLRWMIDDANGREAAWLAAADAEFAGKAA